MEQLGLWTILLALGYAGAASLPKCCNEKSVGGVSYKLVEEMDTAKYGCKSNCVFEREGSLGSRFCFKEGDLEVVCKDDDAVGGSLDPLCQENGGVSDSNWDLGIENNIVGEFANTNIAGCVAQCVAFNGPQPCVGWTVNLEENICYIFDVLGQEAFEDDPGWCR